MFVDVARDSGITMLHRHCGSGKRYLVETMGSGLAWLDYDGDGWLDLYLAQGGLLPGCSVSPKILVNRLYRNMGDGSFENRTEEAGVGDGGYGQGVAVGDIDGDGDPDLYVANYGPDRLYRNQGNGRFRDVTSMAGLGDGGWSSSAAFGDLDGDGDLDLYVVRYLDAPVSNSVSCSSRQQVAGGFERVGIYCHPSTYAGLPDRLYVNDGKGRFREMASAVGIVQDGAAKGLGVVLADLDGDMDLDIYVSNDSTANQLFENDGRGRFTDQTLLSGTGYNGAGRAEAGMGLTAGDVDGDMLLDLFVTNLSNETNTLYRNLGSGLFADETRQRGLAPSSVPFVGFGTRLADLDNDGDLDLVVVNGHILDNVEKVAPGFFYAQPMSLFQNDGRGRFTDVTKEWGAALLRPVVARGLEVADYDRDGDLDLAVSVNNGWFRLLRNEGKGLGFSLEIRLMGTSSNREGIGAQILIEAEDLRYRRVVGRSGSYQSNGPPVVHCGLGRKKSCRVTIRWPGGGEEKLGSVSAGQLIVVTEGRGITERRPLTGTGASPTAGGSQP